MRRRGFNPTVLLWLLVGLTSLAIPGEPQAQERTLADWQKELEDRSPEVRQAAAHALVHFGPLAVPSLIPSLRDLHVQVRLEAIWALGTIGPSGKDAVPALAHALGDLNVQVRQTAAWALSEFGPTAKDAVPELTRALKDSSKVVQANAANALRAIGPAAKDAALALAQAAWGAHSYVRENLVVALKAIGPAAVSQLRKEVERDPELQPFLEQVIRIIGDR